jgi:hypothetical protein
MFEAEFLQCFLEIDKQRSREGVIVGQTGIRNRERRILYAVPFGGRKGEVIHLIDWQNLLLVGKFRVSTAY